MSILAVSRNGLRGTIQEFQQALQIDYILSLQIVVICEFLREAKLLTHRYVFQNQVIRKSSIEKNPTSYQALPPTSIIISQMIKQSDNL